MSWTTQYIVLRLKADGSFEEVFHPEDLKKAKYIMSYVAEPGDVCCRTPLNPKHSKKNSAPEYFSHKANSGTAISDQTEWNKYLEEKKASASFAGLSQ